MIQHEVIPLFGSLWWKANIPTVLAIVAIVYIGKKLSPIYRERFAIFMGIVLLSRAILIQPYQVSLDKWTVLSSLPLQMCAVSAWLSGIVLLWRSQLAYEFLFFWGIPGAFHSLLTPEFTLGTQGLLFPEYFLEHGGIIASALYLTVVLGMKPRKGSWWRIALLSQPILVIIGIFDWIFGANYMYLCEPPIVENPFIIGEWPWYIILLEFIGLMHFLIVYIPFGLKYRRKCQNN